MADVDRLREQVFALNMQAKQLCLQSVWALVQALEARDQYSAWHSQNVTFYARSMANVARWDQNLRTATEHAAMLHDLGKIGVPDRILQKPDSLTPEEARVLRQVPLMTCKILEPLQVFGTEILIIRHLRERFDGGGYPDGLTGAKIPIGSRLLAVAEAFDAITSDRAYRAPREMAEALEAIKAEADTQFDPEFVELLERTARRYSRTWQAQIDRARARLGQPVAASEAADGANHG
jgi:HD-GYP domain-containing protein (c-di-GMP phosphodiesterase class II)